MGRASSSARTATASPGGPTRARRPVWTMDSTLPVPRASATRPEVACSSWLRSGIACSRSRSPRARGSSSSRESRSFWRRSVDTQVPLAGLLRIHTFEEGDLGPLDAQVAVEEVLREPGADNRVGLERVEGCPERVGERTDAQAVSFSLVEFRGISFHQVRLGEVFLDPAEAGQDEYSESQVWAGRRVGGAEFEVELACLIAFREWRDADGGLPVTLAHVTEARAPVVGTQAQVGDHTRRREGAEGGQVLEDAGSEAHVDVYAVADALGVGHRCEARPVAEPAGHLADDLPRSCGPVGGGEASCGRAGDLELSLAVLREEDLRLDAGLPEGGHGQWPERLDEPLGLEREAWPRLQGRATQHELLLEGGDQAQPGLPFKPGQRVLEEGARAGIPRAPVGVGRVAEKEVQGRDFIPKIHPCFGGRVGQEAEIPGRAPRVRLGDGPEGRERLVGRNPSHAPFEARLELRGRDRTSSVQAG